MGADNKPGNSFVTTSESSHASDQEDLPVQQEFCLTVPRDYDPDIIISPIVGTSQGYYFVKRVIDFLGALTLLVLLLPLFALISIAILIYSPGPIFYAQERVGTRRENHKKQVYWRRTRFYCYKFRTMKVNADSSIHQAYVQALIENNQEKMASMQGESTKTRKLIHDPRITRPGALLRKYSLDELPQFWNVVRGDMSLVGPRPAIPYEVEVYQPWHRRRLAAKPGITGLQQITARCTADFDEQVKLDIEYTEKQSIWLDLKIILRTPLAIVSTKGAY